MIRRPRLLIECANWSIHRTRNQKTGIQDVVTSVMEAAVALQKNGSSFFEIRLLPVVPRFCTLQGEPIENPLQGNRVVPFDNPLPEWIKDFETKMGLTSREVWGWDLSGDGYEVNLERFKEHLEWADQIHIQSMVNGEPWRRLAPQAQWTQILYDLIPILFPESCDEGIAHWFRTDYLKGLFASADRVIGISENTARDYEEWVRTQSPAQRREGQKVFSLTLPTAHADPLPEPNVLKKWKLTPKSYIVSLGSIEPRKNIAALLRGFANAKLKLGQKFGLKLVMVGATGWKSHSIERQLDEGLREGWVIRTGYVSDSEKEALLRFAASTVMLSHYEGFGLPVAQSLQLGGDAIASWSSSLPEATRGLAVFVNPDEEDSVALALKWSFENQLTEIEPGFGCPKQLWTWSRYLESLLQIFQK
jgi:glycosyltransferase involved in cell wall biosynthesis